MMGHPTEKQIGSVSVAVDYNGWPRWTRFKHKNGTWGPIFNEEETRDLHYALTRIIAFLDDMKIVDRNRGIDPGFG